MPTEATRVDSNFVIHYSDSSDNDIISKLNILIYIIFVQFGEQVSTNSWYINDY